MTLGASPLWLFILHARLFPECTNPDFHISVSDFQNAPKQYGNSIYLTCTNRSQTPLLQNRNLINRLFSLYLFRNPPTHKCLPSTSVNIHNPAAIIGLGVVVGVEVVGPATVVVSVAVALIAVAIVATNSNSSSSSGSEQ